ncbi:hypothetical protein KC19_8G142200 [Ceratodon purpureus]|uniref:Pectinesterase n=1 Tax=Ceratodon purpureus TaxID=3225 RepID=A0A8T0H270_CERPU|nr:hypothetical protein KC19_8G142200 [Ceratodon purpureus]
MARAAAIIIFSFLLLSGFLVEADNVVIRQVCSATRYPSSCESAFSRDGRWQKASAQGLVEGMTAMAAQRSRAALVDAQTLTTGVAPAANDMNLTTLAEGCMEILDLAEHYVRVSNASMATAPLEDIQAWLSGALTQSFDCYYSLTKFQSSTSLTRSSTLAFVANMTDRLNTTVELISNALALTDARLTFGPDATLWRPPPESREEQLRRLAMPQFPTWITNDDRAIVFADAAKPATKLVVNVTVALGSAEPSIQAAVDKAPSWSPKRFVIYIKAGVYKETVHIPKEKINLSFLGDGTNVTVITGSLHVGIPGITTRSSATVAVTGAGFMAWGITFENTAGPEQHQAVALRVESDRSAFQACSILGHQDSLYTHSLRQFYKDCTIAGTVDFIFGNSAAVFQTCKIVVRVRNITEGGSSTSTLTAQGRTDPGQNTALVFQNCSVDGNAAYKALHQANPARHHVYLGRPWKTYSRTVFLGSYLSQIVEPQGWLPWNGSFALDTLLDAEYGSYGPGGTNLSQRISWSTQLSFQQAQRFSAQQVLQADAWLPATTIPYSP